MILLGHLDSKGCKYLAIGEVMKVTRAYLVSIKGERYQDGLYCLNGIMLTSGIPLTLMGN